MNRTGAKNSKPFSHVNLLCPGCSWTPGMFHYVHFSWFWNPFHTDGVTCLMKLKSRNTCRRVIILVGLYRFFGII